MNISCRVFKNRAYSSLLWKQDMCHVSVYLQLVKYYVSGIFFKFYIVVNKKNIGCSVCHILTLYFLWRIWKICKCKQKQGLEFFCTEQKQYKLSISIIAEQHNKWRIFNLENRKRIQITLFAKRLFWIERLPLFTFWRYFWQVGSLQIVYFFIRVASLWQACFTIIS